MRRQEARAMLLASMLSGLAAPAAAAQQVAPGRGFRVDQRQVDIYNVAGTVTLRRGGEFTITATPAGPEARDLRFAFEERDGWGVFTVIYPDNVDRIATPEEGRGRWGGGRATVRVRDDGTFGSDGGNDSWWRRARRSVGGREIEIGGRDGFRGWANLEITVPDGREVKVHLISGRATIDGVTGDVMIDTWAAGAEATNIAGNWLFDSGSGDVEVRGFRSGVLRIDTGSGGGFVEDATCDLLDVDTGSGEVEVSNVTADRFRFDTGSGAVRARGLRARRGVADTGSGGVDLEYAAGPIDDLLIDTGSGGVRLTLPRDADARLSIDTGSGGINVNRAGALFERRGEDGMVLRFGEGRGRIRIDTGSGGVTIR
jgi:hypothetical protein